MPTQKPATHRVMKTWFEGANGVRTEPVEVRVHISRGCDNCAHDGLKNSEWCAEGGVGEFGRCINLCSAADSECAASNWCDSHQTGAEFDANIYRPHSPVFWTRAACCCPGCERCADTRN